jgi:hypothetical protein
MWADLATLTPSLVVCTAFLIGVALFLRREMSPSRRRQPSRWHSRSHGRSHGSSHGGSPGGSSDAQQDDSRHTGDGGSSYSG